MEKVRVEGDEAVKYFTAKFDRVQLDTVCVPIEVRELTDVTWGLDPAAQRRGGWVTRACRHHETSCAQALPAPQLPAEVTQAFDVAYSNIRAFHEAQRTEALEVGIALASAGQRPRYANPKELPGAHGAHHMHAWPSQVETMPGVKCRRVARPIGAVGVYVPGGTAVLPSSALMLAVPAAIAGCKTIVLATPPRPDGSVTPEVLYCARKAGVTHILKAGGAQAVAAMAWGTATCPKVDKIAGPGNQFVTAAKMLLQVRLRF